MRDNGKQLEGLVALIEKLHLPPAFDVKTNERVFYQGIQVAEFDIEIRGRLGTTDVVWLIECRDRPTEGPAPASWVEQLVGRRTRFGFNKVTAVSTTGFAKGASDFAQKEGIETREVRTLAPGVALAHGKYELKRREVYARSSKNAGGLEDHPRSLLLS